MFDINFRPIRSRMNHADMPRYEEFWRPIRFIKASPQVEGTPPFLVVNLATTSGGSDSSNACTDTLTAIPACCAATTRVVNGGNQAVRHADRDGQSVLGVVADLETAGHLHDSLDAGLRGRVNSGYDVLKKALALGRGAPLTNVARIRVVSFREQRRALQQGMAATLEFRDPGIVHLAKTHRQFVEHVIAPIVSALTDRVG
jgi:hypothetical protein